MVRPQVIVTIAGETPTLSPPTATGTLFVAYAGTTGPTEPAHITSLKDATDAVIPDAIAAWIQVALGQGVSEVYVVRASGEDTSDLQASEWTAALDLFTPSLGAGQVTIPGIATEAAHEALLAHVAGSTQRIAFLDVEEDADAATVLTTATSLSAAEGADHAALFAPWVQMPGIGGPRSVPASILAAGLAARGDAATGHANHAPIASRGAITGAVDVVTPISGPEADEIYEAGANVFRVEVGAVRLTGWLSLSQSDVWRQLNVGRLMMAIGARVSSDMYQFIGLPIDGQGALFSQVSGTITGYLVGLFEAGAINGATADDALDVVCDFTNNTRETISRGEVHADVAVRPSLTAELITIRIVASLAG